MSLRAAVLKQGSTVKTKRVHIKEWSQDVIVRELSTEARSAFLANMTVDAKSQTGSLNITPLAPYITELILDPETEEQAFELADRDTLLKDHPGVCQQVLFASIGISDLGAEAAAAAEGNSKPTPSGEATT